MSRPSFLRRLPAPLRQALAPLAVDRALPDRDALPRYVAPLPAWLEDFGLSFAWVIVAVNAVGTAFGFWYYGFHPLPLSDGLIVWQFAVEPPAMWPFVPDSPVATGFIALSLGLWAAGRQSDYVDALAFFGCWKLGLWTPFVLLAFSEGFLAGVSLPMYLFLLFSHLAMVVEAFLLHRYSDFPVGAVAVAVLWYGLNDLVDYFVPLVGTPHHTLLPEQAPIESGALAGYMSHPPDVHYLAAAGAVLLTLTATFLALATRVEKLELRSPDRRG